MNRVKPDELASVAGDEDTHRPCSPCSSLILKGKETCECRHSKCDDQMDYIEEGEEYSNGNESDEEKSFDRYAESEETSAMKLNQSLEDLINEKV